MPTLTLAQLRAEIRLLGDYENSGVFTTAYINSWINKALEEYHTIVVDAHEGYYTKTDETLVTVAGTQTVALPSDFLRVGKVERKLGADDYGDLRRLTLAETARFRGQGPPRGYMLHGGAMPGTLRLFPKPDAVYTIRLTYDPVAAQLVADADSFAFLPGGDVFVIYSALLALDERDEKPLGNRKDKILEGETKIKALAKRRDEGEPEYLIPRGASYGDDEDA